MIRRKIDRKAWIRIVEAFIAILIILGAVLVILARQGPQADISEVVYEKQRQILDVISNNDGLRTEIITTNTFENNVMINDKIFNMVPANWDFATNICPLDSICPNPLDIHDKEVYTTEVVITSTLDDYNPKKLRFFVWGK